MQCKQCGNAIESKGKKPKRFCSDACRMKYKRTVRNEQTNKKRTETNRNEQETNSSIPIETVDAACGDKLSHGLPANYGQPNCQCWHCHNYRAAKKDTARLNHGPWLNAEQLVEQGYMANRVSLPGDIDYEVVAV